MVIMSNACDTCGYRSSDIKAGGGVSEKGSNITLAVSEQDDLRRDVIKAESASISIPEADLEVTTGQDRAALCASSCMTCMDDTVAATHGFSMLLRMSEDKGTCWHCTPNGTGTCLPARFKRLKCLRMMLYYVQTATWSPMVVQAAWVALLQLLKAC